MNFLSFIEHVSIALAHPLPGEEAQLKMSSMRRIREMLPQTDHQHATPGSVLILLYPHLSDIYLVFIQRPLYDGVHAGQISFPGGRCEPEDGTPDRTALRESWEEVGVSPDTVTILGRLSDLFIPPSNFLVTPFIGYTHERPTFTSDPVEVEEIIELPLLKLFETGTTQRIPIRMANGMNLISPAFVINGHIIWGATAMILSEFKEVIRRF